MDGRAHRYTLLQAGEGLSYTAVLSLWQKDASFRDFFIDLLRESPFAAYRWETPPVTAATGERPFAFVLVDDPWLDRRPDSTPFDTYFSAEGHGIVTFENLGRDALMLVPSPRTDDLAYGHLAAFVRHAPAAQVHALWQTVGQTVVERLGSRPLWLSTAGGGVAWLHVRLDSRPKYYAYAPYKTAS